MTSEVTITVSEAARRLGIGRQAAYNAVREGRIPVLRFGRRLVVPIAGFNAMLTDSASHDRGES